MASSFLDQVLSQADIAAKVAIGKTAPFGREREALALTIAGEIDPRHSPYGAARTTKEIASILEVVESRYAVGKPGKFGAISVRDINTAKVAGRLGPTYGSRVDVVAQTGRGKYGQFSTFNNRSALNTAKANLAKFGPQINKAIDAYYEGKVQPAVPKATHYWNPSIVTPAWAPSITNKVDIGPHRFGRAKSISVPDRNVFGSRPSSLKAGAKGPEVADLQAGLKALGFDVEVDGKYGPATAKAVEAFQQAAGLKADAVAGPNTQTALSAALAVTDLDAVPNPFTDPKSVGFKGVPSATFASPVGQGFKGSPELASVSVMARDFAARDRATQAVRDTVAPAQPAAARSTAVPFADTPSALSSPAQAAISGLIDAAPAARTSPSISTSRTSPQPSTGFAELHDPAPISGRPDIGIGLRGASRMGSLAAPALADPNVSPPALSTGRAVGRSAVSVDAPAVEGLSFVGPSPISGGRARAGTMSPDARASTALSPTASAAGMAQASTREAQRATVDLSSRSRAAGRTSARSSKAEPELDQQSIADRVSQAASVAPAGFGQFGEMVGSARSVEKSGPQPLDPQPADRVAQAFETVDRASRAGLTTAAPAGRTSNVPTTSLAEVEMPSPAAMGLPSRPGLTGLEPSARIDQAFSTPAPATSRASPQATPTPADRIDQAFDVAKSVVDKTTPQNMTPADRVAQAFDVAAKAPEVVQVSNPDKAQQTPASTKAKPAAPTPTRAQAFSRSREFGRPSALTTGRATSREFSSSRMGGGRSGLGFSGLGSTGIHSVDRGLSAARGIAARGGTLSEQNAGFWGGVEANLPGTSHARETAIAQASLTAAKANNMGGVSAAGSVSTSTSGRSSGRSSSSSSREDNFTEGGRSDHSQGLGTGGGSSGGSSSGSSKVLCTEFHRLGWLPTPILRAEHVWTTRNIDPRARAAYRKWAKPLIRFMERHQWLRRPVFKLVSEPWAYEAAYRLGRYPHSHWFGRLNVRVMIAANTAIAAMLSDDALADEWFAPA